MIFLIIDVFSHAWEPTEESASDAFNGKSLLGTAAINLLAMFGGIGLGLLGLTFYESKFMKRKTNLSLQGITGAQKGNIYKDIPQNKIQQQQQQQQQQKSMLLQQNSAYKIAMMIAIGIGTHNFSEGLAIGQSYVSGAIPLAILLIVGFAAHNATEGFGIAGPLTGLHKRPNIRFIILLGLIGGGPTFIGTIIGSLWASTVASILFLSIAGGALIYVSLLMYNSGRLQTTNTVIMAGIFVGLVAGFITDLMISVGGA